LDVSDVLVHVFVVVGAALGRLHGGTGRKDEVLADLRRWRAGRRQGFRWDAAGVVVVPARVAGLGRHVGGGTGGGGRRWQVVGH